VGAVTAGDTSVSPTMKLSERQPEKKKTMRLHIETEPVNRNKKITK